MADCRACGRRTAGMFSRLAIGAARVGLAVWDCGTQRGARSLRSRRKKSAARKRPESVRGCPFCGRASDDDGRRTVSIALNEPARLWRAPHRAARMGGGAGGSGVAGTAGVGAAGGNTTFGAFTADGGAATPSNTTTTAPTPAAGSGVGAFIIPGGLGGPPSALNETANSGAGSVAPGANSQLGNGGAPGSFLAGGSGLIPAGNATGFGAGGGAGGVGNTTTTYNSGWGGNAGAYLEATITSPPATIAFDIGAAGTGGAAGTDGAAGAAGAPSLIEVTAFFL
jgi:hypothetical protein